MFSWQRAVEASKEGFGRTTGELVLLLARWKTVSAPLATPRFSAGREPVQRNLDRMVARGVVLEFTGQGR